MVFTNFCLFFYKTHQVGVLLTKPEGGSALGTAGPPCPPTAPSRNTLGSERAWPRRRCRVGRGPGAGRVSSACPAAFQDDCPLASLPLLGYSVSLPGEADGIHKEHVFKLQFKSHIYFFRAENKYTFGR